MKFKIILLSILAALVLLPAYAQTNPTYYSCYNSCPSNTSAVGCEIYVNQNLTIDIGLNTNFYYYEYINDTTITNNLEELVCYYNNGSETITGGGPVTVTPVPPVRPVPPPIKPKPGQPPVQVPAGGGQGGQPGGPGVPPQQNQTLPGPQVTTPAGGIPSGTSSYSGKYYTCTKDCPKPRSGFFLIGCDIVINHGRQGHNEGRQVPLGSKGNGYVFISSKTDYDDQGNQVYDEILACSYWKSGQSMPPEETLPPEEEQTREHSSETEVATSAVTEYNSQLENTPKTVKNYLGDENIHMYIENQEQYEFAAITQDGTIKTFSNWIDEDGNMNHDSWDEENMRTTMEVYIDQATIEEISQSENPTEAFIDAWGTAIRYEGLTFGTNVKTFFMDVGMWFAGIF